MNNIEMKNGFNLIGKDIIGIIMDYHKDIRKVVLKKRRKRQRLKKPKKIFMCNLIKDAKLIKILME